MVLIVFLLHINSSFYFKVKFTHDRFKHPILPSESIIFEFFIFENLYFVFFPVKILKKLEFHLFCSDHVLILLELSGNKRVQSTRLRTYHLYFWSHGA